MLRKVVECEWIRGFGRGLLDLFLNVVEERRRRLEKEDQELSSDERCVGLQQRNWISSR